MNAVCITGNPTWCLKQRELIFPVYSDKRFREKLQSPNRMLYHWLVPGLFPFGRAGVGSTRWRKARLQRPLTKSTLVLLTKQKASGMGLSVSSMLQTHNLVWSIRGTKSRLLSKTGRRRSSWRARPFRPQTICHRNPGSLWFVATWWTLFLGKRITIHKLRILRRFSKNSTLAYRSFASVETTTLEIRQRKSRCKSTGTISVTTFILFGLEVGFWCSFSEALTRYC